jgi:hypothetical protein
MNKNLVIGVIAVVVLVLGLIFPKSPQSLLVNDAVDKINQAANEAMERLSKVGASPGSDRFSPCESRDGVVSCTTRRALTQATSTVCAIKSPAATSTLISAHLHINVNTTASNARIAKSATAFATTTLLAQQNIAAATELNLVASTSPITNGANTFSPNTFVVFDLDGSAGVNLTGNCQAVFESLM